MNLSKSFITHTLPFTFLCGVVAKYDILLNVCHIKNGSHYVAVRILLLYLIYPRWYYQFYQCSVCG